MVHHTHGMRAHVVTLAQDNVLTVVALGAAGVAGIHATVATLSNAHTPLPHAACVMVLTAPGVVFPYHVNVGTPLTGPNMTCMLDVLINTQTRPTRPIATCLFHQKHAVFS